MVCINADSIIGNTKRKKEMIPNAGLIRTNQAMMSQHKRIFHYGLPKPVHPGEHGHLCPLKCAA